MLTRRLGRCGLRSASAWARKSQLGNNNPMFEVALAGYSRGRLEGIVFFAFSAAGLCVLCVLRFEKRQPVAVATRSLHASETLLSRVPETNTRSSSPARSR